MAKNQVKAKHQTEAEHLVFEKYLHSSSMLSSKSNRKYSKCLKKQVCMFSWDYVTNHNENKDENEK